ncbi:hypothetical protein N7481_002516 [Penicillium waksmanii]|uniref:uncharacterized protein n=1 Tax=Penicillium waksmanii TaxID=69791 RepID=UPI00254934CC|nr:uncharacterized protein N7481_002516 [Penicillium waksmanii]KAJ5995539.1 hypothetical protein N7481_002516 [Penicillium waksmanii]
MQDGYSCHPKQRTPKACDRCHRQKLKCDTARPCILCVRACRKCETTTRRSPRRKGLRQNNASYTALRPKPAVTGSSPELLSPASTATTSDKQQLNTNTTTSTIDFARQVFNEQETGRILTGASLPGDVGTANPGEHLWSLQQIKMPPTPVMISLLDAYFHRVQWFIMLLVEPHFRKTAQDIISRDQWPRRELGSCMLLLAVAAIGLQSVLSDKDWDGYDQMRVHNIDPETLLQGFVAEIRLHLLDVLEDCQVEAVQIPLLLSSYYVFHNSPRLAWTVLGMSLRAAYALDMQNQDTSGTDLIMAETKSRCWNHLVVSDTFTSMVYGRPVSIDYAEVHQLRVLDDLTLPPDLFTSLPGATDNGNIGKGLFHVMKTEIYEIVRQTLLRFHRLRLGPIMEDKDLEAIASIVQDSDNALQSWRRNVPQILDFEFWRGEGWHRLGQEVQESTEAMKEQAETMFLQAALLQLTYDSALIQIHRSLLERKLRTAYKPVVDAINRSLVAATAAALRISQIPVHKFRKHFAISFVSMQQFTAGVILCIQPTCLPFSPAALEAKAGVLKIIRASRTESHQNRIARHTEQLLTELLKVTNQREMACALGDNVSGRVSKETMFNGPSNAIQQACPPVVEAYGGRSSSTAPISTSQELSENGNGSWGENSGCELSSNTAMSLEYPSEYIFEQLDSTFGAFGETIFNMMPEDQNSSWNWGRTFP